MRNRRGQSSLSHEEQRVPGVRSRRAGAALVAIAAALSGAGASCSGGDECLSTRSFFEQNVWSGFMGQKCGKCHTPDGPAIMEKNAKFVLQPASYPGFVDANLANIKEISKIEYEGKSELLLKPIGQMSHGGGAVIEEGSNEYNTLVELLDRVAANEESCQEAPSTTLSSVLLASPSSTLRRAALDLVGRLPTDEEKAAVKKGGEAALDKAIDGFMKEDAFYERLREIYNDVFLTDRFISNYDAEAIDFMNTEAYPGVGPYRDSDNPAYHSPDRPLINRAIAREPLDFIAYVVKNDKPYTDVVAGDYTVVNPFSAIAYGVNQSVSFSDPTNYNEFKETVVTLGNGATVPHAGVLSTPAFLNRWQTSPTNRNRGRARRVAQFFLATDVLKIADRPIDSTKVTAVQDPTRNSEACTVCHTVIDPIAGGFRGFDDEDYEDFDPKRAWYDDMFPPGYGDIKMDPNYYPRALQWLGPKLAGDVRFRISAVRTIFKGLTSHEPLSYPTNGGHPLFRTSLDAWGAQDTFFRQTADDFAKNGYNLKLVFKAIIKSPYYRAIGVAPGAPVGSLESVGMGRLLTPEMLNRKITAVTGAHWRRQSNWEEPHDWLTEDYNILYGGIDSTSTITRLTAANGLIASVAGRMSNEMSCSLTGWDFTKGKSLRRFFPHIELDQVPESAGNEVPGSVAAIKKNIQHLHQLFLDEELSIDDPEIERTYQLFLDTWHELSQSGDTELVWSCTGRRSPLDGTELPEEERINDDPNFTLRSWQAVMTYLMSDYKFLYE